MEVVRTSNLVGRYQVSKWYNILVLAALGFLLLFYSTLVLAHEFSGGASSTKVLGTSSSILTLGRLGLSDSRLELGGAPRIAIQAATVTSGAATLRGSIVDMKGFPTSDVYFKWGYAPGVLTNTTPVQVAAVAGTYTASIVTSGNTEGTVYYQFYAEADGTSIVGGSFALTPSSPIYWMVRVIPFIFVGIVLLMLGIGLATGDIGVIVISAVLVLLGAIGAGIMWDVIVSLW